MSSFDHRASGVGVHVRARTWPSLMVAAALSVLCAVAAVLGVRTVVAELTRGPTEAELAAAAQEEVAERWRTWPAGRVFPESLAYSAEQGGEERARRVGISPLTGCAPAVDEEVRQALREAGCRAVLRATYLDALGGVVVSVGVVVLPDEPRAQRVALAFPQGGSAVPGLRAVPFKGTVAERFTDAGRQAGSVRQAGPYVVLTTAGQSDGRPARAVREQRPAIFAFAPDLGEQVLERLSEPRVPDCAEEGWRC
ncbi:hypothetical protein [Thermoactinospora rubra]|uniref:hypothetical protein n=1 Tax=Thermoactinospora rubra TaxID=1088767 RepID=UPI001F0A1029|nr:hypothetical protein [Thermoactinospora rubra]